MESNLRIEEAKTLATLKPALAYVIRFGVNK